jgi:hypothetical protein
METYQVGLIALALFGLMGFYAFYSWQRKMAKQATLIDAPNVIEYQNSGEKALYVATTFGQRPLDRVLAHGLAHRGKANLVLEPRRVLVNRVGEVSFAIPADSITGVGTNSAVIDRAVEKDGLVTISWKLGNQQVDSHFRFTDQSARKAVLEKLKELVGVSS